MSRTYRKRKEKLLGKYPYFTFLKNDEKILPCFLKWSFDSHFYGYEYVCEVTTGDKNYISWFESDCGTKITDKSVSKPYRKMVNKKRKNKDKMALKKEVSLYEYNDFKGNYSSWNGKDSFPDIYFWD